jgi:hypothetical protein
LYRIIASVNAVRRDTDDNSWVVHVNVPRCAKNGWRVAWPQYQFASDYVSELVYDYVRANDLLDDDTWVAMLTGSRGWRRICHPLILEEISQQRRAG